jgi:hypothetical protein
MWESTPRSVEYANMVVIHSYNLRHNDITISVHEMTTSWSQLTTTDHAMRRASGRRRYNAERKWQAFFRLVDILKLVDEYGMGHGACQRIADELGVHRSTVSRQLRPYRRAPHPKQPRSLLPSTSDWIRALEARGAWLAEGCGCEESDELHHRLGHVLTMATETLDAAESGELELSETDWALTERVIDVLVGLLG